jgi:hypothetical protein
MDKIIEQRRTQCEAILEGLLSAPAFPFDDHLKSCLPEQHGLYAIARKDGVDQGEYLHAGRSKTAAMGLRDRIWNQHFWGGGKGAESDLVDKVVKRQFKDLGIEMGSTTNRRTRLIAQTWIGNNCVVQWLIVDDPQLRCWAEHYILSILRPIWGQ